MKVITPVQVTNTNLVSTNVTEIYPTYNPATNYLVGDRVVYGDLGVYESLTHPNTGNQPDLQPVHWLRIGPTNRLAMFDDQVSTTSDSTNNITFTVRTGFLDSVALLNMVGSLVTITVRDSLNGTIVYEAQQSLQGDDVFDWYQYFFFDANTQRTQSIFMNIPNSFGNSHTTVTITGTGAVKLGNFVFGRVSEIGKTEYGASAGITDYSRKETDEFGQTKFVKRAFSKRLSARVFLANAELNRVQRVLYALRATPALWIAADDPTFEEPLIVFGFYKDFSTDIAYPAHSYCSLEIEGLI